MTDAQARRLARGALNALPELFTSPRLSAWHRKMQLQVQDSSLLICGDSTGNATDEWVYLLAQKIAAEWPTHTVVYKLFDDSTKTYTVGNTVTIQTGTGARTITIYNCSVSGQTINYALSNVSTITSGIGTPDIVFFSYGINSPQDYNNYRAIAHNGVNAYASRWPSVAVVMVAQHPLAPAYVDYTRNQETQRANYDYAMAEGHICADVNKAFLDYGSAYSTDLLSVDEIHPTAAGSAVWRDTIWAKIKPKRMVAPSSTVAARTQRVWVPAKMFDALDGSPSYAMHHGVGGWLLDPSSDESICAVVDYPSDWVYMNAYALVATPTNPGASTRTAVLSSSYQWAGSDNSGANLSTTTLGTWTSGPNGNVSVTLNATAGITGSAEMYTRHGGGRKPIAFRFTRLASNGSDTLDTDLMIIGVMFVRMG